MKKTFLLFSFLGISLIFPNLFLKQAFEYQKNQQFKKAEKSYQKAIESGASPTIVNYNLGNLYYQTGKISQAIINYKKVIEKAPLFKNAYHNLGKILFLNEEYVKALNIFTEYHQISPQDWETLILIGDTFNKLEVFSKAEKHYGKALQLDKQNENSYIILAEFYLNFNDREKAIYWLDLAKERGINTLRINELKADLFSEKKAYFKALFLYENIIKEYPHLEETTSYRIKSKIIDNFLKAGINNLALNHLKKIIEKYNKKRDLFHLEEIYKNSHKQNEAFEYFSNLYLKNPSVIYPIIKNLLISTYNNNNPLKKDIINFYEKNQLKDEVYQLVKYNLNNS